MIVPLLVFALALQTPSPTTPSANDASQTAAPASTSNSADPDANGVYHKLGRVPGMTMPEVTHHVEPEFTKEARKRHVSGIVLVGLVVDALGMPTNVHVVRSAAEEVTNPKDKEAVATLDQKAVDAVLQYRFKPATLNGKPVPVELRIEVNFQFF